MRGIDSSAASGMPPVGRAVAAKVPHVVRLADARAKLDGTLVPLRCPAQPHTPRNSTQQRLVSELLRGVAHLPQGNTRHHLRHSPQLDNPARKQVSCSRKSTAISGSGFQGQSCINCLGF